MRRWEEKTISALKRKEEGSDDGLLATESIKSKMIELRNKALLDYIQFEKAMKTGSKESFHALGEKADSFEAFKKRLDSFHAVTLLPPNEMRKDMCHCCSCPQYQKKAYCKHGYCEGVVCKMIDNSASRSMEKKKKSGRAKKITAALRMDSHQYRNDSSDEDGCV